MTELQKAKLEAKRLKHQRKATAVNRKLRGKSAMSITQRVGLFIYTAEKPFTTREVAQAVWPKKKINGEDTSTVGTILVSQFLRKGHVVRIQNNNYDSANSGQLIYFKK